MLQARARVPAIHCKVVFLVRSLEMGGSERQLAILAQSLHERGVPVAVMVFYEGGVLARELAAAGVSVSCLGKKGRWNLVSFFMRLVKAIRSENPAVVHGYLNIPNLLSLSLRPFLPHARIFWGIRASNVALSRSDWLNRLANRLEARLARHVDCVIANSWAGKAYAVARGFPQHKIVVVPNGIDTLVFRFDAAGRRRMRQQWGIADDHVLVGMTARLDPVKDYPTFLDAARRLAGLHESVRFVCVGDGPAKYRAQLQETARARGLDGILTWAGTQRDMAAVYSAFDIACSSSLSEGFPNVVGEAMACERICVVTAAGDSARVVGETGLVVPPSDPAALADACMRQLALPAETQRTLQAAARQRIVAEFAVGRLAENTLQALGLA
jgi:glycosyltransferase involved in cell wall biosynthesis